MKIPKKTQSSSDKTYHNYKSLVTHSFNASIATQLKSVELAILLHHFQYWVDLNARLKRNFYEGRYWTYQTLKELHAHFPYWSEKQVRTYVDKLVDHGILLKGNFNKTPFDRTTWYTINTEELEENPNPDEPVPTKPKVHYEHDKFPPLDGDKFVDLPSDFPFCPNGQIQETKQANQSDQKGEPIPDNITNYITNKTPPIPPMGEEPDGSERVLSSSCEDEIKSATDQFIECIKKHKPDYVIPRKKDSWYQSMRKFINDDKRLIFNILKVLDWALQDNDIRGDWNGWASKVLISKNPVEYLRKKYDGIETQSRATRLVGKKHHLATQTGVDLLRKKFNESRPGAF